MSRRDLDTLTGSEKLDHHGGNENMEEISSRQLSSRVEFEGTFFGENSI